MALKNPVVAWGRIAASRSRSHSVGASPAAARWSAAPFVRSCNGQRSMKGGTIPVSPRAISFIAIVSGCKAPKRSAMTPPRLFQTCGPRSSQPLTSPSEISSAMTFSAATGPWPDGAPAQLQGLRRRSGKCSGHCGMGFPTPKPLRLPRKSTPPPVKPPRPHVRLRWAHHLRTGCRGDSRRALPASADADRCR